MLKKPNLFIRMIDCFVVRKINAKQRKSFSLIELALYIAAASSLTSVGLGAMVVVKNANLQKVVENIYLYENALSDFTMKYGELPGNMSYERCVLFDEFKPYCNVLTDSIKATTTLPSKKHSSVIMSNGDADSSVIALNFGRFLKTSNFINNVDIGLETPLTTMSNRSELIKNYLPKLDGYNDVYMHYTYNNPSGKWNDYFITTGSATTKTFAFSDQLEDAMILIFSTLGRYIDVRKGGAFTADFTKNIDKKIDDGMPRTGYLVGLPQGADDSENIEATCDNDAVYHDAESDTNAEIIYLDSKDRQAGCNIAYISAINFAEMLNS